MKISVLTPTLLLALGFAGTASASPIVYDYTGGAIDITGITIDGTSVLGAGTMPAISLSGTSTATLNGSTLSFNISQGALSSFGLCCSVTSGSNTFGFGSSTFSLSDVSADSSSALTLSGGSGSYTFNTGSSDGVTLGGTWGLTGATKNGTELGTLGAAFGPNSKPISGTVAVTANSQQLQMDGVPLGNFSIDNQTVVVTGNIIFDGAQTVPIPDSVWLLFSGLGLVALILVRKRGQSTATAAP
jgi:hypothetical protein